MTTPSPERQVSVASLNMLLKGFDRKHYYPSVEPELRSWPWRKMQLKQLLFGLDADVYCMQEVECSTFTEEMGWLGENGYAAIEPRDDSKGKYPDMAKTAIFFKQNRLEKVWEDHRSRVVLAALRHRATDQLLYAASCHLEGAPWEAATRFTQCRKALDSIARHQKSVGVDPSKCLLVFAGDFNEAEDGAVYECLSKGGLQTSFRDPSLANTEITKTDFTHAFHLSDLYAARSSPWPTRPATFCAPPEVDSSWGDTPSFGAVDFIFYSHCTLQPVAIREPFSAEQLDATSGVGIPSAWHFSDHVPVGGIFEFVSGMTNVDGDRLEIV
jgi:mRNA deadenylase 3'-5' endonuclease subunit Ccr4